MISGEAGRPRRRSALCSRRSQPVGISLRAAAGVVAGSAAPGAGPWLAVLYFGWIAVVSQLAQFLFDGSALLKQERDGLLAQLFGLV